MKLTKSVLASLGSPCKLTIWSTVLADPRTAMMRYVVGLAEGSLDGGATNVVNVVALTLPLAELARDHSMLRPEAFNPSDESATSRSYTVSEHTQAFITKSAISGELHTVN